MCNIAVSKSRIHSKFLYTCRFAVKVEEEAQFISTSYEMFGVKIYDDLCEYMYI